MIASPDMPGVVIVADRSGTPTFQQYGGTSLAAPLWAGIAALIEQETGGRLGNLNPRIYGLGPLEDFATVGLRDVTSGSNSYNGVTGFTAGPLYDQASGWGSADISDFVLAYPVARASLVVKPKRLNFPKETMAHGGAASPFKILTIYNPANAIQDSPIRLEGLGISGDTDDFIVDDNCPTVLTPGGQCDATLQFSPTALGQRRAALVISGNAINAPEQVDLNGIGVPAVLTYHPSALGFGKVAVGTTSVAKTVTLINRTAVGIDISAISVYNPDFAGETACPNLLPAQSSCTVTITFAPSVIGRETGSLIVGDDAAGNQQVIRLNGIGAAF
jgi:subtilase family serine protease